MSGTLRFGIAGLGHAASTEIIPSLSKIPNVQLTAAADVRRDALEKFRDEFDAEIFGSVEEMCRSPRIDVVYVASPNEFHAEHVIAAARNGKHAIVEKPMALSIEQCEAMNAAADAAGTKILCGHTHSWDPPIRKMREIVQRGELGKLRMINTWMYKHLLYTPRAKGELASSRGVILNQGPHQVDIVRLIGGGMVRSVRAMTGVWDPERPYEGAYLCFLEFEDGVAATLVFSGLAYFDTAELTWWLGESGYPRDPETHAKVRKQFRTFAADPEKEALLKDEMRYGGARAGARHVLSKPEPAGKHQPFFGVTVVTCDKGDMRQSPDGLLIHGEEGKKEIPLTHGKSAREDEIQELYEAIVGDKPVSHGGRWGEATLEVCLAIIESARERREIHLKHQVPIAE
jgi:phthalate 4,5-cis-dihydrodiol dehydrogenase